MTNMKHFIIFILFLSLFSCVEPPKEEVCFKLYMIDRRVKTECFMLPVNAEDIRVYTYQGSYELVCCGEGMSRKDIKAGVVDFEIIKPK